MPYSVQRDPRKQWTRPTLQRMDAGSAENNRTGARIDSNPSGNQRS